MGSNQIIHPIQPPSRYKIHWGKTLISTNNPMAKAEVNHASQAIETSWEDDRESQLEITWWVDGNFWDMFKQHLGNFWMSCEDILETSANAWAWSCWHLVVETWDNFFRSSDFCLIGCCGCTPAWICSIGVSSRLKNCARDQAPIYIVSCFIKS